MRNRKDIFYCILISIHEQNYDDMNFHRFWRLNTLAKSSWSWELGNERDISIDRVCVFVSMCYVYGNKYIHTRNTHTHTLISSLDSHDFIFGLLGEQIEWFESSELKNVWVLRVRVYLFPEHIHSNTQILSMEMWEANKAAYTSSDNLLRCFFLGMISEQRGITDKVCAIYISPRWEELATSSNCFTISRFFRKKVNKRSFF